MRMGGKPESGLILKTVRYIDGKKNPAIKYASQITTLVK